MRYCAECGVKTGIKLIGQPVWQLETCPICKKFGPVTEWNELDFLRGLMGMK